MGCFLKEDKERKKTRFTWFGIGIIFGLCEHGNEPSVSIKYGGFRDHLS